MTKKDVLDVDRPEEFLARERRVQRVGAVVLLVFVLAGAAGAFGGGPLSRATGATAGLDVEYERFGRITYRSSVNIRARTTAADGQPVKLAVSRQFLQNVAMLEVRPADSDKALTDDSVIFEIPAAAGAAHLELHYEPEAVGALDIVVSSDRGSSVAVRQLVFF
jgi:hypothetical protein